MWWVLLLGCFGTAPTKAPSCDDQVAARSAVVLDGLQVPCGEPMHVDGRPGDVVGTLNGIAIRPEERSFARVCETANTEVVAVYASVTVSEARSIKDRVRDDLAAIASESALKTVERVGESRLDKGPLFGQEVDQVTTPVSLMGMPRTQLVRGRIDGTKACMVSVIYDPTVITDPAVLEPIFAAPAE